MTAFLISYDLNDPGQNYEEVLKEIKSYKLWAKISESSYAVKTNYSAAQIYNLFSSLLDRNDNFYAIHLTRDFSGQGQKAVNEWLEKNL